MVFSSNIFLFAFLPAVLALYFLCPCRYRNALLLAVSLFFYAWGEPVYIFLMAGTVLINYVSGLLMAKAGKDAGRRKTVATVCICINLLLLGFFKYASFAVSSINTLLPATLQLRDVKVSLPIGISFYIFQSMSYVIDLYRGQVKTQRNLVNFGTYVTLFPQLIAGPIVRYRDVAEQLEGRSESIEQFASGVRLFIIGLAKKLILANKMGELWGSLNCGGGSVSAWIGMFAYTLQIYFDFSGYSDMAIGLGRMFGFEFLKNFDYPYISTSITEFWRRWHISLSTWFREYVYIPLGGNRCGTNRQILNLFIVWTLTGLWHGAGWNFVLWGLYYAVWLCIEKFFLLDRLKRVPKCIRWAGVFLLVSFGWMLFYFENMADFSSFVIRLVSFIKEDVYVQNRLLAYTPNLLLCAVCATPLPAKLRSCIKNERLIDGFDVVSSAFLLVICTASLAAQSYNPFIYFRF